MDESAESRLSCAALRCVVSVFLETVRGVMQTEKWEVKL